MTLDRTFFVSTDFSTDAVTLYEFDLDRFTLVGQRPVEGVTGTAVDLVRWGERGLALLTRRGRSSR